MSFWSIMTWLSPSSWKSFLLRIATTSTTASCLASITCFPQTCCRVCGNGHRCCFETRRSGKLVSPPRTIASPNSYENQASLCSQVKIRRMSPRASPRILLSSVTLLLCFRRIPISPRGARVLRYFEGEATSMSPLSQVGEVFNCHWREWLEDREKQWAVDMLCFSYSIPFHYHPPLGRLLRKFLL